MLTALLLPENNLALPQAEGTPVAEEKTNPTRKRAAKIKRAGASKGMQITLLPTPEQAALLRQWAGASRWLWNWGLALQNAHYRAHGKSLSTDTLSSQLTTVRKDPALAWLSEVPRTCLTRGLANLNSGWQNFFDGVQGKRLDKPGKPDFWARGEGRDAVSFQVDSRHKSCIDLQQNTLRVPGLGFISAQFSEPVPGIVSKIKVFQKGTTWLCALSLVDVPQEKLIRRPEKTRVFLNPLDPAGLAALDASVVHGAVVSSDGKTSSKMAELAVREKADKVLLRKKKYERRVARLRDCRLREAGLNPKVPIPKGTRLPKSRRQEKLQRKVASFDLKALFCRRDLIHKFTTEMVRSHHTIVVETLALKAMAKSLSKGFRRRFHQACMGEILRQLEYKCEWHGRTLIKVDKWFPSSKRCSNTACHQKNTSLKLNDRAWTCPHCLTEHDRDENAAINLWQEGWRLLQLQQSSTSCPAVGSTVSKARRVRSARLTALPGQDVVARAMKRESSSPLLPLATGMDPGASGVG